MVLNSILIFIGFVLLIKGAEFLVEGASEIAKKFNIPELVIGLTIVAIGTSMPELMVSVTSALEGHADLAIGNVVGSNIANMFLILGICSIIRPLIFKKETKVFEIPFTIIATILLFVLCINNGNNIITRNEGFILIIGCILFIIYNLIMAKKGNEFDGDNCYIEISTESRKEINTFKAMFGIIVGIIGLKIGGDLVVNSSTEIAKLLGITEKLISLTIVAFSTSLPELITSIQATRKGETDMAIGNIIGSQLFNILLIIGISTVLAPINYSTTYNSNLILLIIGSIILWSFPFVGKKNEMTRYNGLVFVLIYVMYIIRLICIK